MPKSGTHLLTSLIEAIPSLRFSGQLVSYLGEDGVGSRAEFAHAQKRLALLRQSHYIGGHLTFDAEIEQVVVAADVKIITIVRDPRAHVMSWAHYLLSTPHIPGRDWVIERYPDLDSLLPMLVRGVGVPRVLPYLPDVGERFRRYSAWNESSTGLVVRFEDLVGNQGGGSDARQIEETQRILDYVGGPAAQVSAEYVTGKIFSTNAATFRTGQIDSWRGELPPSLADETFELCGPLMETWGYGR